MSNLALNEELPVEHRAHAVKCLAGCSQQPFDRQLPSDPGEWAEEDIRTDEIANWAKTGYPEGTGFAAPTRHPSLDNPSTKIEKAASRLDKRLAKKRGKRQDPANPRDWLAVAEHDDLEKIASRWELPEAYLEFLTKFSPIQVTIENKRFWNGGLQLFGAAELIAAQDGYAYDPVKKKTIRNWPKHYLVIASHGGDPFVLDLKASDGNDAPVLTAEHGTGKWEFEEEADSFEKFLKSLAK